MDNNFKILVSFRNAGEYLRKSLDSIFSQTHKNFKVLLVNDDSSDDSNDICQEYIEKYPDKIIYTKTDERKYATYNHQKAINEDCDPEDIVVQLDGDDWFVDEFVLSYINNFYNREGCLMMYGQARYVDGKVGNAKPYPTKFHFDNKRQMPLWVSHLRSFKAKLFHEIKNQDPELNSMKYDDGRWFTMAYDCAQVFSLMDIAGWDKVKFNDKVLYIYNNLNPTCEFRTELSEQEKVHRICCSRTPFKEVKF